MAQSTVNYLSRDFTSIKNDLINWAKTYHSDKLVFFNDANPDIMYLEMVAYVGDMLSYYTDKTFNENFRTTAQIPESLVRIANNLGFYNTGSVDSIVNVDVSITVPYIVNNGNPVSPDVRYYPVILPGSKLKSSSGIIFEVTDGINFTLDQNRIVVPNLDSNGKVTDFTITKTVTARAGESKIQSFYVSENSHNPFLSFILNDSNVTEIIGVIAVAGNQTIAPANYDFIDYKKAFYQVTALTQSTAFFEINSSSTNVVKQGVWQPIPNRYIVRRDVNGLVTITFGNQSSTTITQTLYSPVTGDEYFNNVHDDVDLGTLPPVNSTVFIKYKTGGGIVTNAAAGTINKIILKQFEAIDTTGLSGQTLSKVRNSLTVNNPLDASGGRDVPTMEELREITGKTFAAQDRGVTPEDIKAMVKLMPPKYGSPFRMSYEVKP